jgi:hypothetical protein
MASSLRDMFCTLSVACHGPWSISSWVHIYLGLLGTHVRYECIKLIKAYITSKYCLLCHIFKKLLNTIWIWWHPPHKKCFLLQFDNLKKGNLGQKIAFSKNCVAFLWFFYQEEIVHPHPKTMNFSPICNRLSCRTKY